MGILARACQTVLLHVILGACIGRAVNYVDKVDHVVSSYMIARDIVEARWSSSWSEELPCASPRLKGHVLKTGSGVQSPTIGMTGAEVERFTFERLPIYSRCQV
jgi:hypothetical protein